MPRKSPQPPQGCAAVARSYALITASIAVTTLVRFALNPLFGQRAAFIVFFPALVFSAWVGGWGGGLTALALSALAATFFFINPSHTFAVPNPTDQVTLLVFVIVGLSVSAISSSQRRARQQALRAAAQARRSERALRESEARYRRLLETASEGIAASDAEDRITYVNPRLAEMLGYAPEELLGRSVYDLMLPEAAAQARELHQEWRQATRLQYELGLRRRDGAEVWAVANVSAVRERGEYTGTFSLLTDITERRQAELELARAFRREQTIAAALQRSLLHVPPLDAFPGLAVATAYEPAAAPADAELAEALEVGGDFLDAFALSESRVALVVGDVSGKGLVAAARTAEVKYTLRGLLREYADPAVAMTRLNNSLTEAVYLDEPQEGFICVALAVVDTARNAVTFVCAGAEPPLIVRAGGAVEEVGGHGPPLAVAIRADYAATRAELTAGDAFFMVTDGITEARRGKEFFGYDGFAEAAVRGRRPGTLDEAAGSVLEAARRFGGGTLHDDACVLVVERS